MTNAHSFYIGYVARCLDNGSTVPSADAVNRAKGMLRPGAKRTEGVINSEGDYND